MTTSANRLGFTLIELIIVVAIISVLAGMAVPYYNDYVSDTRRSVLKQNMANLRKVINDFRGDHTRGPFRVQVTSGSVELHVDAVSNNASGSELVSGVVQAIRSGNDFFYVRRRDIVYLPALPTLEDPQTGARINWGFGTASVYFCDYGAGDGRFDIASEFAYTDNNGNKTFDGIGTDTIIYASQTDSDLFKLMSTPANSKPLDFIGVTASDSTGVNY